MNKVEFYLHTDRCTNTPERYGVLAVSESGKICCCPNVFKSKRQAEKFIELINSNDIRWNAVLGYLRFYL